MNAPPTDWSLESAVKAFGDHFPREPRNMFWKAPHIIEGSAEPSVAAELLRFVPSNSNEVGLHNAVHQLVARLPPALSEDAQQVFAARVGDVGLQAYAMAPANDARLIVLHADVPMVLALYAVLLRKTFHLLRATKPDHPTSYNELYDLAASRLPSLLEDESVARILADRESWRRHGVELDDRLESVVVAATEELSADGRSVIDTLVDAGEQFVIAHELSHHLLGHTHDRSFGYRHHPAGTRLLELRQSLDWQPPSGSWNDRQLAEFDADAMAFLVVAGELVSSPSFDLSLWTAATFGALLALPALEDAELTDGEVFNDDAHPPLDGRIEQIYGVLFRFPWEDRRGHPLGLATQTAMFREFLAIARQEGT